MRNDAKAKVFSRKIARRSEKSFFLQNDFFLLCEKLRSYCEFAITKNCESESFQKIAKRKRSEAVFFLCEAKRVRNFSQSCVFAFANLEPCSKWLIQNNVFTASYNSCLKLNNFLLVLRFRFSTVVAAESKLWRALLMITRTYLSFSFLSYSVCAQTPSPREIMSLDFL